MRIRNLIVLRGIIVLILLSISGSASSQVFETEKQNSQIDYTTVIHSNNGFVALGYHGRIHWISNTGTITKSEYFPGLKLNSMLQINQQIITVGDNGAVFIGSEFETFRKIDCGINENINSITSFNDMIVAGSDAGEILVGNEITALKSIQLKLHGNIISVSASKSDCYGVTDKGEIINTQDGMNWNVLDFNSTYKGFYKPCEFTKVLVTKNQIAIIGKQDNGLPVFFYSVLGNVWTQRNLNYINEDGMLCQLEDETNDIYYDHLFDFYILVCNNGKMMKVPSCSHCNELFLLTSENLTGISGNENSLILVGENGFIKTERVDYF